MLLGDFDIGTFCGETAGMLRMFGYILTIFKIIVPILIIIFGMLDFGKAVVAEKPDEIKKSAKSLGYRVAAGVLIFFIPSIVCWLFGTISDYNEYSGSFTVCRECLLHPGSKECVVKK